MTSAYDPRRTRPRPNPAPEPDVAPVDALLGPELEPGHTRVDSSDPGPVSEDPGVSAPPRVAPGPSRSGAPSAVLQLAPLLALLGLIAAIVWWFTRRRAD